MAESTRGAAGVGRGRADPAGDPAGPAQGPVDPARGLAGAGRGPVDPARRAAGSARPPDVLMTADIQRWLRRLDPERRAKVRSAMRRVAVAGSALGRPHVDRIHGSRLHKLKELRVDRGIRILFAFDSHRNAVMLVGGDKTGQWNSWYPSRIARAERLYLDHERRIGKEPRCLSQREAGRTSSPRSR